MSRQRPAARWLLVPRLGSQPVPTLDGHPVPLGPDQWLDLPTVPADLIRPGDVLLADGTSSHARTTPGVIA